MRAILGPWFCTGPPGDLFACAGGDIPTGRHRVSTDILVGACECIEAGNDAEALPITILCFH
jgi:hypothetical protein